MPMIYLSGPMTGIPDFNYPAFDVAKAKWEERGYRVVSPADLDRTRDRMSYYQMLKDDIRYLLTCDAIYMMTGWEKSKGAKLEYHIAHECGLRILMEPY